MHINFKMQLRADWRTCLATTAVIAAITGWWRIFPDFPVAAAWTVPFTTAYALVFHRELDAQAFEHLVARLYLSIPLIVSYLVFGWILHFFVVMILDSTRRKHQGNA
jgi:hypothetical protein